MTDIPPAWPREHAVHTQKSVKLATHARPDQTIIINASARSWIETFRISAAEISELRPGWNGPGSHQVNQKNLEKLIRVLLDVFATEASVPQLVPLASGGVQAEWHFYEQSIEIGVTADGQIFAYATDEHGDYVVELEETWFIPNVELFSLRQAILDHAERTRSRAAEE